MSMKEAMEKIREKHGVEIVGKHTCEDCGKEFDLARRKNTETNPSYTCPYCLIDSEDNKVRETFSVMMEKQKLIDPDRISHIPMDIRNKTFDDYMPTTDLQRKAKDIAIKFANDDIEESSLVFQGDTGIGKSHLSKCIRDSFRNRIKSVVFIDSPELMNRIKNSFGYKDSGKVQENLLRTIANADLLILDDIGAEYVKPDANGYESWAADIIFQIVNSRLGKQNIYTTNYTSKDLNKKYGMLSKRIISRMMNKAKVIKVDGDDQRLKGFD
ncbi:ATP-binding protein [Virgibacillus sp. C22-A2]|uniref:ATP-binding protein n=1 Tax=Virgibacillus tibetensis TaxID=3042313 RepID=A0ABU6KC36_9BACI|nr:ATP-binding protein [Virgibacillus sp. C22-A2]